jgi:Reverse transcriptase (RNA-dependent DNA polymerase)/Endonuclease/Exonuclease/phosphatase family
VRGLRSKTSTFYNSVISLDPTYTAVALTETWLNSSIHSSELFPSSWTVLRRDRQIPGVSRGGGVLFACRPPLSAIPLLQSQTLTGEDLWLRLFRGGRCITVGVVYIPPNMKDDARQLVFDNMMQVATSIRSGSEPLLVLGDFNLPSASVSTRHYFDMTVAACGLDNVAISGGSEGGLDLVLWSGFCRPASVSALPSPDALVREDFNHCALWVSIPLPNRFDHAEAQPPGLDVSNIFTFPPSINREDLYREVTALDWSPMLSMSPSDAVNFFYSTLYNAINQCTPPQHHIPPSRSTFPRWFSPTLIALVQRKWALHRIWKKSGDWSVYVRYSLLRSAVKKLTRMDLLTHTKSLEKSISSGSRNFFRFINDKRSNSYNIHQVMTPNGMVNGPNIPRAFADHFSSFTPSTTTLHPTPSSPSSLNINSLPIDISPISCADIHQAIRGLGRSTGPDGLPPWFIKLCSSTLAVPLQFLFNSILSSGFYPDPWRISRITPIFKAGDRCDVSNYRPIAILSSIPSVLERVLLNKIRWRVDGLLCDSQHGFRSGRSTVTNLTVFSDIVAFNLDKGRQVSTIYLDLAKAFERVPIPLLINSLDSFGFSPRLISFFSSSLNNRSSFVRVGLFDSYRFPSYSGVIQGSTLGPLLFNIYINHLPKILSHSSCLLYADDIKIFTPISLQSDLALLALDLGSVDEYLKSIGLSINIEKSRVVHFSRSSNTISIPFTVNGQVIVEAQSFTDLGVHFDRRLDFRSHIIQSTLSSYRILGFVLRTSRLLTHPSSIRLLYGAFVLSKLEYCSVVWSPHSAFHTNHIEKVQKAYLRFLYQKTFSHYPFLYPTNFLLGALGYVSLELRRDMALMRLVFLVIRGQLSIPEILGRISFFVPESYTRGRSHHLFFLPVCHSNLLHFSPLARAASLLNDWGADDVDNDIFIMPLNTFLRGMLYFLSQKSTFIN